ncbi:hypothetical protein N7468_001395 [Penicillium chermesinum]|uniref:DNA-directed RNA polymerase n=1 Tax=Penicillium chermesinum TaxID=63820 RepID=A0A9W9TX17_9EURO|nr:uncharacterized protein N7468_001395 [Penicillium chermesinum]KAJ5246412.1 hypothetical protein N7468_001395 [Penicillium chermesinum]
MLSRVARQHNAIFHLRKSSAHRALGTSTLRRHTNTTRPSPAITAQMSKAPEMKRRPSFQSQRNLATATDSPILDKSSYMPFQDAFSSPTDRPVAMGDSVLDFSDSFDPSSLIILNELPEAQPKIFRKVRGVGGDEEEMKANFEMSLKVGRFDRAAALMDRLSSFYPFDSPEYVAFHNRYLKEMVSYMIAKSEQNMVAPLQKWFEVDMPSVGMRPDAVTYAVMTRMALRMLHGAQRDRAVRRYWELAKKSGLHEDLLAVEVLTDQDLGGFVQAFEDPSNGISIEIDTPSDNVPEVLAADQRGLGLSSLHSSLGLFSGNTKVTFPESFQGTEADKQKLLAELRQKQLEADTLRAASNRWRAEFSERQKMGIGMTEKVSVNSLMSVWHASLVSEIEQELRLAEEDEGKPIKSEEQKERVEYAVFLRTLDPERLAALTILTVMHTFSHQGMEKGVKLSALASAIGQGLKDELIAEASINKAPDNKQAKRLREMAATRKGTRNDRIQWHTLSQKILAADTSLDWSPRTIVRVGSALMNLLINSSKAPSSKSKKGDATLTTQPAFQHSYSIDFGKRLGLIHMHPEIVKTITKEPPASVIGRHLPMTCQPKPWTGVKEGGYLMYQNSIFRSTPGETLQARYMQAALENGDLKELTAGLDVLGSTAWVINPDVLNVMIEAWNSGDRIASLAPLEPDLPTPPAPDREAGSAAIKAWRNQMRDIENQRSGFHSVRCFQNFQLVVARAFRQEKFYLPHNIDFRGRAYPLPPYLNQMGADNARGLLLFADAKPLGESGLRWLKIQIANLAGYDKASMSEREQFTMDHLDQVLDSANKGLHGERWWLNAEDPWQCLAACCELRNALQCSDPTQYMSRLPIHQDGSCNGLQHYAALGGDQVGAQQVNLEPSDRPSDVYTGVAEFVKQAVAEDAAAGDELAKVFDGKVARKIVKQTVMTNVYGVTYIGAVRQIRRQLIDHYPDLTADQKKQGAKYLAKKVFNALGTMFNGAHEIQYWLGDCANRITSSLSPEQIDEITSGAMSDRDGKKIANQDDPTKHFRNTVIWTSPLGLPVVQPYRTRKARRVVTTLQHLNVIDPSSGDVVSRRKQLQAFPPNFIHSLDATHMIMSANACHKAGLTFSAVHDSFWTHAGSVDSMNRILRDSFVKLHSEDVIGRLAKEFDVRYGNHLYLARIRSTNEIGKAIRAYRQSKTKNVKLAELIAERRRQELLHSEDPAEQAEGRAMVTAASIFESMGGTDQDLHSSHSFGEHAMGHVPSDLQAAERAPSNLIDKSDPAIQTLFGEIDMMNQDTASVVDSDSVEVAEDEGPVSAIKPRAKPAVETFWLWLPLRFPKVPTKGAWDLTRIRDSKYFFS